MRVPVIALGSRGFSLPLLLFVSAAVRPQARRGSDFGSEHVLLLQKRGSSCRTLGSLEILCAGRSFIQLQDNPEFGDLPHFNSEL
jgi:hypothetical protein